MATQHWSQVLRKQIDRVGQVDWRLATVSPERCPAIAGGTGIIVDSLSAYDLEERSLIADALRMGSKPQIASVAVASPADRAGLRVGDDIIALNATPIEGLIDEDNDVPVATQVELLFEALPIGQASLLTINREGERHDFRLTPVPRCNIRTVLVVDDDVDAYSDADAIALTTGMMFFARNEDEVALVAGHELAHAILRRQLERDGIKGKKKEDAADRLGAELASCAGYDAKLANALWLRMDETRSFSFLPTFTHRSSKVRYRTLNEVIGRIDCAEAFPTAEHQNRAASSKTSSYRE